MVYFENKLLGLIVLTNFENKPEDLSETFSVLMLCGEMIFSALERQNYELKLNQSKEKYKLFFETSSEAIIIINRATKKIIFTNPAAGRMLGYSKDEFLSLSIDNIHPKKELKNIKSLFKKAYKKNKNYVKDIPCMTKNGEIIYTDISTGDILSSQKKLRIGFFTDVTDRKLADDALKESEEKFRTLAGNIPGVVYRAKYNEKRNINYISPAIKELSGYSPLDFNGKNALGLNDLISPDCKNKVLKKIKENVKNNKPFINEYKLIGKNKNIKWIYEKGQAVFDKNKEVKWIDGVLFDFTDKKRIMVALEKSEARFRELANMLPLGVFEIDLKGKVLFSNLQGRKYFNYSEEDIKAGINVKNLLTKGEIKKYEKNLLKRLKNNSAKSHEYIAVKKNGNTFPVEIYSNTIKQYGVIVGLRGIVIDITERKKQENILINAKKQAEQANNLKSEFIALASHDLRAPFNGILALSEILVNNKNLNAEVKNMIEIIKNSAEIQLAHVETILHTIMSETENINLNLEKIFVSTIIESSVNALSMLAKNKNIEIDTEIINDIKIHADYTKIVQVLNNLISNAIKHSFENAKITIKTFKNNKNEIEIHVIDNGPGIDKSSIPKLFESYSSASKPGTKGEKSTGLGLFICKRFVLLHGGKLNVKSSLNQGSDFYFTLPLKR